MATCKCPGCGEILSAPDSATALRLRCTQCGKIFQCEATDGLSGPGSRQPDRYRTASLPKSAIAIVAFCACAVVGVLLYAFVLSEPAVVVPQEAALTSKPAPADDPGGEGKAAASGPAVAVGPTVPTMSPPVRPLEPQLPPGPPQRSPGPPVWPLPKPAPAKPKPEAPPAKPEPKVPPAKPVEPKTEPPAPEPPAGPAKPEAPAKPTEPETPAKPAPGSKEDPDEPTAGDDPLVRIVSALYLGKIEDAGRQLEGLKDAQKDNPLYHLALGRQYTRASDNANATGAFRTAVGLDPQLPDAYLYLGCSYAIGGRVPQALEQLQVGQGLAPQDARFTYAEALSHFRGRDWEKSKAGFDAVAGKGGPLAAVAKKRAECVAGIKAAIDQINSKRAELDKSLQGIQAELKKARAALSKAEAQKEALRSKYNTERSNIERRYVDRVRRANREYDRLVNDWRSRYDDRHSDSYQRRRDAGRRRDEELRRARSERDRDYNNLDARYKPQVSPLNVEINQQKKEVAKHMQAQAGVRRETTKLRAEEASQLAPPKIAVDDDVRRFLPLKPSRMRELVQARKSKGAGSQ